MIKGSLFTRYFLEDGIRETAAYKDLHAPKLAEFTRAARIHLKNLAAMNPVSEAETESEFIYPVLSLLGWPNLPQQKTGKDGKDIPDALLFLSEDIKAKARPMAPIKRFPLGTMVVENEARDTKLGIGTESKESPAGQILRYMSRADIASNGAIRWGLLTNGYLWRLYDQRAPARAEGFVEFDLADLLTDDLLTDEKQHWLRVFLLIFRVESYVPEGPGQTNFIQFVLAEGKKYEQRITAALSKTVFNEVFPGLIAAIGASATPSQKADTAWRSQAREAGLKLLFRLLFLLYAEDRDLLPVRHEGYKPYALRTLREDAEKVADDKLALSPKQSLWWQKLSTLFKAIADGDDSMGLPPYNGGLFDESLSLAGVTLTDAKLAPLIDKISREGPATSRRWINYRDLSVQQLGSIYEQLLEQDVVTDAAGGLVLRPNPFSRKTTGSYYTPDELVQLILRRAIGPLLAERNEAFKAKAAELAKDKRPKKEKLDILAAHDAAAAFINLRVIDPAMGSGHFLVSLVDYLADQVLAALADAPGLVGWTNPETPYRSPLADQLLELRQQLLARAQKSGWPVRDDQLDDRHLIRRIILKRVIYGVDMNPMAVELAKLSLWLHSFTVGAPLSFLDHHLRVGDSLFGEFVAPVQAELRDTYGFVMTDAVTQAANAAAGMAMVEALSDADISEVKESASGFAGVEEATSALRGFLDIYHAARWLPSQNLAGKLARDTLFGGGFGDPVAIANGAALTAPKDGAGYRRGNEITTSSAIFKAASAFLTAAKALTSEHRFLHWEASFPGVWQKWETTQPAGGFDAVIGNPPWDRMKLQEVEWFAARKPEIALAQRASDRKKLIAKLRKSKDPLAGDFALAETAAETAVRVARTGGEPLNKNGNGNHNGKPAHPSRSAYPLMSGGDINIYSLFVERAQRLVRADGIVGLVVPSGIAADLGAAPFFRSISTTGRLSALLDFENRRTTRKLEPFFPDVDSRFKFLTIIFGGSERKFVQARCAFFQQDAEEAEDNAFALTPMDFEAVNPNTGTAPVFRNQRDAEITLAIYSRLPVLVDRRGPEMVSVWPVRYIRMLDMTNDSAKFLTAAELEKSGAYRVKGGVWEKGDERFLPLMAGRTIHHYDHRAASITSNPKNLHNPFNSDPTTDAEHKNPEFTPSPQFWVSKNQIDWPVKLPCAIGFRDIARPNDARTIISSMVPEAAYANTIPLLFPTSNEIVQEYCDFIPLLLANLTTFVCDYIARQKMQGTHLNSYILEQLPIAPAEIFNRKFGPKTAAQIIRDDVLHLTYVSHDMAGFAQSQGYSGPPFAWDEEDRLHRRARLDALFFHLYGIEPKDIKYILSTFPIVIREETQKYGSFRSEKLILGYYNALAAGKPDADIAG